MTGNSLYVAVSGTGNAQAPGNYSADPTLAVSGAGDATAGEGLYGLAVSGGGNATGYSAVSGIGNASGITAISGTGDANAEGIAISGTGNANGGFLGVSVLGVIEDLVP
jgi:hypothetical protein